MLAPAPPRRSDNRASKMHKLTEPQVSAHECAKPGENNDNVNVPRRGTTHTGSSPSKVEGVARRAGGVCHAAKLAPTQGDTLLRRYAPPPLT